MEFKDADRIVSHVTGVETEGNYDGIIVKRLEPSNTLDEGRSTNQTHIAISGEQMNMFPYLMADGYFVDDYTKRDEVLKKYFITQIPLYIFKDNVEYLSAGQNPLFHFDQGGRMEIRASIVRSRRKDQSDQVQLSLTSIDDKAFVAFRKVLHTGDYLILLKHKERLEYDCIGVRDSDDTQGNYNLWDLNNKFFKLPTNTKVDIKKLVEIKDTEIHDIISPVRKTGAENILLYGVPGAGKSHKIKTEYCSDENFIERVVFHPDYTYSDFVGQILPRIDTDGKLKYVFTPGPFTKMLGKAVHDPGNYYYLIIEELNRGNAPAIFGEIFQLLDRKDGENEYSEDELGESEYGISNYDVAKAIYGDENHQIKLPSNMYVIATMNTADQNVFTLDMAFQRRWSMKQIENKFETSEHSKDQIIGTKITWGAFATVINDLVIDINIDMASSEDKRLGTYFAKKKELTAERFPGKVLKYLWDDAFKRDKESVFKEEYKSLEDVVIAYEKAEGDKLSTVLRLEVYKKMLARMQNESGDH